MKYNVSFNIRKGYADISVDADNKDDAENLAWEELMHMFISELRKLDVDINTEENK